jgi:hypothetical protein
MKPQEYFLALEPGNCTPESRARMRARGRSKVLAPQEKARFTITVDVVDGAEEIEESEQTVACLR